LIIVSAHYGLASAFTDKGFRLADGEEVVIDVTTPVQALVQNSHLVIPGGRGKVSIPVCCGFLNFYSSTCSAFGYVTPCPRFELTPQDPCIGEKKKLRIVYTFRGALHQVTLSDSSAVRAPLRGEYGPNRVAQH
jgi:DnaJ family protein C protein 11